MANETFVQAKIRLHLAKFLNLRLFRNNVGVAFNPNGSVVKYGLCEGSSDLIGFTKIKVTPEMVGKEVAVFTAIEVKDGKRKATDEQGKFLRVVNAFGGIGFVTNGEKDAEEKLSVMVAGLTESSGQ